MKWDASVLQTKIARFTNQVVSLAKKAVAGEPAPAHQPGDGGYADRVIVALHGLCEYLDHPYRRLMDILYEMPHIVGIIGLEPADLPDFSTVCERCEGRKLPIWRVLLRLSAELHGTGESQAIDATGMGRISSSQHYAKRTNYAFRAVKTTVLIDCETDVIFGIH